MDVISAEKKGTSQKSAQILQVVEKEGVTSVVRRGILQESVQTQRTLVMLLIEEVAVVTSVMNPVILPANVRVLEMAAVKTEAVDATSVGNLATWHGTAPVKIQADGEVTVSLLSIFSKRNVSHIASNVNVMVLMVLKLFDYQLFSQNQRANTTPTSSLWFLWSLKICRLST